MLTPKLDRVAASQLSLIDSGSPLYTTTDRFLMVPEVNTNRYRKGHGALRSSVSLPSTVTVRRRTIQKTATTCPSQDEEFLPVHISKSSMLVAF